ncbi:MAG: glycosyltransferase [Candidatus Peribacteria bacterium]|nr:glycosyltransferase [Candidatus Peribacteria bacterium]
MEILIYDDASTDNTLAILHRREKKDPRIQVFSEP